MLVKNLLLKTYAIVLTSILISSCGSDTETTPVPTLSAEVKKAFGADPTKSDTDGDGLTDEFEIKYGFPFLKPDNRDTNSNGISDSDEDSDSDGLTNIQEQQYSTNPLTADSDGDGLSDKDEILTYKTDPNNKDTDGDGIPDGREVANGSDPLVKDADKVVNSSKSQIIFSSSGQPSDVTVQVNGSGDLASQVVVKNFSDTKLAGQIGQSFDISLKSGVSSVAASITLPYDKLDPNSVDVSKLAIFTINPKTGAYEELPSTVDVNAGTIQAKTTHFSPFFIANKNVLNDFLSKVPQTCDLLTDPNAKPADIVLVIDSSGSMTSNDPNNLRRSAAKSFASKMKSIDRVAVVDFDSSARLAVGFSNNLAAINSAIDTIDSSGGTDIGSGVSIALTQLTTNSDSTKNRAVILLTDGDGSYSTSLTTQLSNAGIRVFAIGLTGAVNDLLLQGIASGTNGGYKKIQTASGLDNIFTEFSSVFGDTGKDTDGDGLTDCQETQGILLTNVGNLVGGKNENVIVKTDPNNPDTDGDGIPDGSEISIPYKTTFGGKTSWTAFAFSRPDVGYADSDGDSISDKDEHRYGTNPLVKDSDGDGINDYDEIFLHLTDPGVIDSDGDGLSDKDEITRKAEGFDPLVFDYKVNSSFRWELMKGFVAGDLIEINNTPELIGQVLSGVVVVGDIRDFFANLFKGEWANAGLSAVGVVPIVGDAAKSGGYAAKFLAKYPNKRFEIIRNVDKYIPEGVAKYLPTPPAKVGAWTLDPFTRGKQLEVTIGNSIPGDKLLGNFPSIDVWDGAKATSIKTLDTSAKTYQNAAAFQRRLERYVVVLKGFPPASGVQGVSATTGTRHIIKPEMVATRELVIGIPSQLIQEFDSIAKTVSQSTGVPIIFKVVQ
jgi:hypothetical protein